jgi:hypothetical protein
MAPQTKSVADLLADLRAHPDDAGVMENILDDLLDSNPPPTAADAETIKGFLAKLRDPRQRAKSEVRAEISRDLASKLGVRSDFWGEYDLEGGRRRKSQTKRFGSCVKAVRKTVKARKGSSKESAAIAICTTTLLHPRGRTIKRYRKGRLLTQRRR